MNFHKIVDSVRYLIACRIMDAKYPKAYCKGTRDDGSHEKQVIPNRHLAVRYARNSDPLRYKGYLNHQKGCEHPHYTGAYYCSWCDGWHLTSSPIKSPEAFEQRWRDEYKKALAQGNYCDNAPDDDEPFTVILNFPDYSPEYLQEYLSRFTDKPKYAPSTKEGMKEYHESKDNQ